MNRMLNQAKNIFIVGIKGVAMTNLAVILKKMGKNVCGSDIEEEFITAELLHKNNISLQVGFNPSDLPKDTDIVTYSSGHQGKNNPQVLAAQKRGIKTITQAEFLGELEKQFKTTIAVCGCHGKTTTSSLLAYALQNLGAKPSYMIGSPSFNDLPGGNYAGKDYFVVEADEYGVNPPYDLTPKFHFLNPDHILCTNIDFDHPDVYSSLNQIKSSFLKFFKLADNTSSSADANLSRKPFIFCADDRNLMLIADQIKKSRYLTYGYNLKANLQINESRIISNGTLFTLSFHNKSLGEFTIHLFGEKNISNAAGVILTLIQLGFSVDKIREAIKNFSGAKRRFELVYQTGKTYLFDDYAHHPKEIETTILAARKRFPGRRIIVIFQPHTFSRTEMFLADFASTLSLADQAYILPIFPSARENSTDYQISSKDIAKIQPKKILYLGSQKDLILHLTSNIKHSDVIFTMGAGDVYKISEKIIPIIKSIES